MGCVFTSVFSCYHRLAFLLLYLLNKLHHSASSPPNTSSPFTRLQEILLQRPCETYRLVAVFIFLFIYNVHFTQGLLFSHCLNGPAPLTSHCPGRHLMAKDPYVNWPVSPVRFLFLFATKRVPLFHICKEQTLKRASSVSLAPMRVFFKFIDMASLQTVSARHTVIKTWDRQKWTR